MPGITHQGPHELPTDISPFQTEVKTVPPATVVLRIARCLSATTMKDLTKQRPGNYIAYLRPHSEVMNGERQGTWDSKHLRVLGSRVGD